MNIWPYLSDRERFEFSLRYAPTDRQSYIDWSFLSVETQLAILREKFILIAKRLKEQLPYICHAYDLKYPKHPNNTPEQRLLIVNSLFESLINDINKAHKGCATSTFGHTVQMTNHIDLEIRFDLFDEEEYTNYCTPNLTEADEYVIIDED